MNRTRIPSAFAVVAAACAALVLAACNPGEATIPPDSLVGGWRAVELQGTGEQAPRTEHQIRLRADGTYQWSTRSYGAAGRPEDGLVESFEHMGSWRVQGDRLGLQTLSGFTWRPGEGTRQLDYLPRWEYRHRLEVSGDLLTLHYLPTPEMSVAPYTRVYHRFVPTSPGPTGS